MDVGPGAVADKAAADVPKQAAVVNLSSKEVQLSSTSGLQRFFMGLFAPSSGTKRSVNPYATGIGSSGPAYMPRRRTGGPVNAGGSYVVGEGGPEIFIPSTRGHILSNGLSNRIDGMFEDGTNDEMLEGLFEGFVNPETGGAFTSTEKKMNDLADQFKNLNGIRPDHPDDPFSLANPENLRINLERLSGLSGQGLIDEIAAREEERRQKVNELTQQIASPIGLGDSGGLADQDSPAQSNPDPFGLGMADLQFGDTALEEFQIDTRTLDFGAPGAGLQWSPLDWQEQSGITNAGDQRIEMVNEDQLAEGFKRDVLEAPVDLSGATMAPIRGLGETENVRRQSNPEASEVDPGLEETENARTQAELEASAERRRLNREAASKRAANRRAQRASEMPGYSPFTRSMLTIDPAAEAPAINAAALPNNANLGARAGAAANAITRNDLDVLAKDATIKEGHGLLKELIGKVSNSGLMGE
jgi:hypothetical protein